MKTNFILHHDSLNVIDALTDEQTGKLLRMMRAYTGGVEYECADQIVHVAFISFKNQFDRDNEKYAAVCERNKENGSLGGRPRQNPENPSGYSGNPDEPRKPDNDKDSDKKKEIISTNVDTGASPDTRQEKTSSSKKETVPHTLSPTSDAPLSHKRDDIDTLLDTLRLTAEGIGAVYDKKQERMFAKHILDAIEFGSFAEKVRKTRIDAAVAVMKASVDSGYRKGVCAGPMMIYQNYADVYNRFQQSRQKASKNDRVGVLPGV